MAPGPGSEDVLIGGLPAWRALMDQHACPAVSVSGADGVGMVMMGSPTVLIDFMMACRMGDIVVEIPGLAMGPMNPIVMGCPTVMIGEVGTPSPGAGGLGGVVAGLAMSGVSKAHTTKPEVIKVVKVSGTVAGTKGLRKINAHKQRATNYLKSSRSASEGLSGNAPTILVRGCKEVHLTATTTPAQAQVTWEVKPNQNTNAPPSLTPNGKNKAVLGTGQTGSFSVIATAGDTKVVWNVVFVSVEVDTASTVPVVRKNYVPGTDINGALAPGAVASGVFTKGQNTWEATVTVNLVGGASDGKLGIDKVKLKILQNGETDTLSGHYAAPPPNSIVHENVRGGFPVLDSNGPPGGGPGGDLAEPTITVASCVSVTPETGPKRKVWTGDSPAGGFPMARSDPAKGGKLVSISGINGFKTAVASISTDAPTEYMVHADIHWQAHFDGTINAAGFYVKDGAYTVSNWMYKLISAGTGGQDACNAGYEIFEPRFNNDTFFDPPA